MNQIRKLRESRGWTQKQLAEKLGVTESTVSNYENGVRKPNIDMLKKLSSLFHVTVDRLIKSA